MLIIFIAIACIHHRVSALFRIGHSYIDTHPKSINYTAGTRTRYQDLAIIREDTLDLDGQERWTVGCYGGQFSRQTGMAVVN